MSERTHRLAFRRARDQCCMLCNWPALADLEGECVRVDLEALRPFKHGRAICFPCIDALAEIKEKRRGSVVRVDLDTELVEFLDFLETERR